jgi:hypothetical protein
VPDLPGYVATADSLGLPMPEPSSQVEFIEVDA